MNTIRTKLAELFEFASNAIWRVRAELATILIGRHVAAFNLTIGGDGVGVPEGRSCHFINVRIIGAESVHSMGGGGSGPIKPS